MTEELRHVPPKLWRALTACAVGVIAIFWVCAALARDPDGLHANAPNHEWHVTRHNANGQWCCDKSDGHAYYGNYAINKDGSVTIDGRTLPNYMILNGPNPTGHSVWWYTESYAGHIDYCFSPGPLG